MTTIAGRYEITAKLGEGGMGVVFRAYDPPPLDRHVAVKTLHEFADPLALELFYKECSALKSISHPNIVEIFDMGEYEEDGHRRPFFVMPLLPGETLDQLIRRASHRLTVERVVEIFAQTCRGLHAAHEHGLVHRDLKPSNIFVMADDSVKIIDFGVAHAVHSRSRTTGYDKGTLLYMAPEQVQHKPVSVQSDIYSLGVTLYEALTRRQPFRGASEDAVIQAILSQIPPPASDLNPAVSHVISRVVHKAMAKQPWNRFDTAREFGDILQKALRNEPIALFDPSRTQPRIQTASKALEKGDHQFAGEIVSELEAEGNIDPQITLLRAQIDQVARQKTVAQLLESARARYEEEEDPLALQKLQELLQLDPTNGGALGLKSKIEDRRSERQIEKWIQLARQHMDNHSYGHAREALQNALVLRPKDPRATRLLKEIESDEQEYVRLRREKTDLYQAAVNAWKNGEVSQALSQMKLVLDLDRRAPDASSPDAAGTYQSFYDKIRSEHDAINTGYAEARRHLAERSFARALEICRNFLARYPGQALFQALKFDVEEQQRQQLSAFIADVDRRLEAEPDLEAKVHLLREAVTEYPDEEHFKRLAKLLEDKRDLVNSIVERARVHEGAGQITEAISDLETLQTIYAVYPGLRFEKDRLRKRLEQHTRDTARAKWVRQIDGQLDAGNYPRATELLDQAEVEFPDDAEIGELRKLSLQGHERAARADQLVTDGQELCAQGQFTQGVDLLRIALQLDDRTGVRMTLRDLFVAKAQERFESDWQSAEAFADMALELDPNHALARSLRAQALDKKRNERVEQHASQARRLQSAGDFDSAMTEVETGLAAYPSDPRLTLIAEALTKEIGRTPPPPVAPVTPVTPVVPGAPPEPIAGNAPPPVALDRTRLVPERHPTPPPTREPVPPPADRTQVVAPPKKVPAPPPSPGRLSSRGMVWAVATLVVVVVIGALLMRRPDDSQPVSVQTPIVPPQTTVQVPPTPAPTPDTTPAAPAPASLALQQLPPGAQVLLDDAPIGTVDKDGRLSYSGISPGPHTLAVTMRGFAPASISREFGADHVVTLSNVDLVMRRSETPIEFLADSDAQVTVSQAGQTIQQFTGPRKVPLPDGSYEITARGPSGIPTSETLTVAGSARTVNLRNIAAGMEGFDLTTWTKSDNWFTRRGGAMVLYERRNSNGRFTFTIRLDQNGNPFSSGTRLTWAVGFTDNSNYVMLQLDKDSFYRTEFVGGTPVPASILRREHGIPTNGQFVHLSAEISASRLVHQYSLDGTTWRPLDAWDRPASARSLIGGRFGFFLPGIEELFVSNFSYYPPVR